MGYRDDRSGKITTVGLPKLEANAAITRTRRCMWTSTRSIMAPLSQLIGDTGSLARLQDPAATTPWPVKLAVTAGTAKIAVDGSMTQPIQGKGYNLALNGSVPDASALTPLLGGFAPPPLRDVQFAAKVADQGKTLPAVSALTLHVGASDLGSGLLLDHLEVAATAADQPVKMQAAGKLADQPLAVTATTGPLALLLPGAKAAPFPVDASLQAGSATLSAKGAIADPPDDERRIACAGGANSGSFDTVGGGQTAFAGDQAGGFPGHPDGCTGWLQQRGRAARPDDDQCRG